MAEQTRGATLRRAIEAVAAPDDASIAALGDLFTEDVVVWTPNVFATDRDALADWLGYREEAFSDVALEITALDVFGNKGFAEFAFGATFSGPLAIDEDTVLEPNGQRVLLGAAAVADFDGGKIKALRGYFDELSLLEQLFTE